MFEHSHDSFIPGTWLVVRLTLHDSSWLDQRPLRQGKLDIIQRACTKQSSIAATQFSDDKRRLNLPTQARDTKHTQRHLANETEKGFGPFPHRSHVAPPSLAVRPPYCCCRGPPPPAVATQSSHTMAAETHKSKHSTISRKAIHWNVACALP
eukprot:COSAG06_NODE_2777_length_6300_cov_38.831963_8_plen_152_part_00